MFVLSAKILATLRKPGRVRGRGPTWRGRYAGASSLAFHTHSPHGSYACSCFPRDLRLLLTCTQDDEASVVSVGCCGPNAAAPGTTNREKVAGQDATMPPPSTGDLFSSFNPWSASSSREADDSSKMNQDLFANSFNVFSSRSHQGSWMPFQVFGVGALSGESEETGDAKLEGGSATLSPEVPGSPVWKPNEDVFGNMFGDLEKAAEGDSWVDMAASMSEDMRKRSSGMDVHMMGLEHMDEVRVKIGKRLQEAKESSQAHTGQADGEYVLRTVTVWEVNFWEACEESLVRIGELDPDFITNHMERYHDRDLLEHPDHWTADNTPLGCLLRGVPLNLPTSKSGRAVYGAPSSIAPSRVSDGIATLLDPAGETLAGRNGRNDTAQMPHIEEELTPAQRFRKAVKNGTVTIEEKLKFARTFAKTNTDWMAVKEHLHGKNPVVVSNYNGRTIYQSDLKRCNVREIEAIMRWRQGEVHRRKRLVFYCVGKPLPDMYQRCIHRLPHDAQDVIREKLAQIRRHGSTALDLQEAARIVVENGGGYSAAVELKYEMEEPDHLLTMPTLSQAAEMERAHMMKGMREGVIEVEEMLESLYSATGSKRVSAMAARSKAETPGYLALVTPRENVDLYKARYIGDDSESLYSSLASRPPDAVDRLSLASGKVEEAAHRAHAKVESGMPYINIFKNTIVATDKAVINRAPRR